MIAALAGIVGFVVAVGALSLDWPSPADPGLLLAVTVLLPAPASLLWGRQAGAGLIAAFVAIWLLPAAAFAALGWLSYEAVERFVGWFGTR